MGKIEAGTVRKGDPLMVMPNRASVKVQTVMLETREQNSARVGENVRIRIVGVEEDEISSGFVLSSVEKPILPVKMFDAQLAILDLLEHKAIFTAGYG